MGQYHVTYRRSTPHDWWITFLSFFPNAKCRCRYYNELFGHETECPRRRRRDAQQDEWPFEETEDDLLP